MKFYNLIWKTLIGVVLCLAHSNFPLSASNDPNVGILPKASALGPVTIRHEPFSAQEINSPPLLMLLQARDVLLFPVLIGVFALAHQEADGGAGHVEIATQAGFQEAQIGRREQFGQ